jgi:hypothetical protein
MKLSDTKFNKIYEQTLSQADLNLVHDEDLELDIDSSDEEEDSDYYRHHHSCKDIKGMRAILKDMEEAFGVNDDDCATSHIDVDDLHDFVIDKLNSGCCDPYTSHYIHDRILSHNDLTPEHVFHAFWMH